MSTSISASISSSDSTCEISAIDTTTRFVVPAGAFVEPVAEGHEQMNMPSLAFLINHTKTGKTYLFDMGLRKDWWNSSPAVRDMLKGGLTAVQVSKSVNEVLKEGGVDDGNLDGIILSHGHFDHTGDLSLFPASIDLMVGPGFKQRNIPAYPTNPQAPMLDSDFKNRKVYEIDFTDRLKIGSFESNDVFGDGSFFLLNAPGHYIGHMAGLARVTPTTFILLAADTCHFGGQIRPSSGVPLPQDIPPEVPLDPHLPHPCPASLFETAHRDPKNNVSPFYLVSTAPYSFYEDPATAQVSQDSLQAFDADENIMVCIAHDNELHKVVPFFPKGTLNPWKQEGWKPKARWTFVDELPVNGKTGMPPIITGFNKDGKELSKEQIQAV